MTSDNNQTSSDRKTEMEYTEAVRIVSAYGEPDYARPRKPNAPIRPSHHQFTAARFFIQGFEAGQIAMRQRAIETVAKSPLGLRSLVEGIRDIPITGDTHGQ